MLDILDDGNYVKPVFFCTYYILWTILIPDLGWITGFYGFGTVFGLTVGFCIWIF
jgi:hypothetical protein